MEESQRVRANLEIGFGQLYAERLSRAAGKFSGDSFGDETEPDRSFLIEPMNEITPDLLFYGFDLSRISSFSEIVDFELVILSSLYSLYLLFQFLVCAQFFRKFFVLVSTNPFVICFIYSVSKFSNDIRSHFICIFSKSVRFV